MTKFPSLIQKILMVGDAWIVGSAALLDGEIKRDLDIMVDYLNWPTVAVLIPEYAKPNTFGGWKFESEGIVVDVWPDSLTRLAVHAKFKAAYHFNSGTQLLVYRNKDDQDINLFRQSTKSISEIKENS